MINVPDRKIARLISRHVSFDSHDQQVIVLREYDLVGTSEHRTAWWRCLIQIQVSSSIWDRRQALGLIGFEATEERLSSDCTRTDHLIKTSD